MNELEFIEFLEIFQENDELSREKKGKRGHVKVKLRHASHDSRDMCGT